MVLPVPSEMTATVGAILTAAEWNSNVRDGINFLAQPPLFVGNQATAQSVSNAVWTAVSIDTTVGDSYSGHSNTTNNTRYTAQVAGWYACLGSVGWAANSGGVRYGAIFVNGSENFAYFENRAAASASSAFTPVFALGYLAAGSYVELRGYQSSGAALSTAGGSSGLGVWWVHA